MVQGSAFLRFFLVVGIVTGLSIPAHAAVSVTLTPQTASLRPSQTQAFTATVTGTSDLRLTWYVNGIRNGNSIVGTVTTAGLYTAPATRPAASVTVQAVSSADPSKKGSAVVSLLDPIVVMLGPPTGTLTLGMTLQFGTYIVNASNPALQWSVNGIAGGNAAVGTIDAASSVYTTPAVLPSPNVVTIKAASVQDPRASATATMTLMNPDPIFTNVLPRLVNRGFPTTFRLSGYRFVQGSQVLWNGQPEPTTFVSDTELTFSHTPTEAAGSVVSLSLRNPNSAGIVSGPQDITVLAPVSVLIAPSALTVRLGGTALFQSGVLNSIDQSVAWSVNGVPGGNTTVGTISPQGLYTPPATLPAANIVSVRAASVVDPQATVTASVTLWNALPAVSGTTPSQFTTATTGFSVNGWGFAKNATVTLDGQPVPATAVSPTLIQVTGATVSPRTGNLALIKVTNPDPGGSSSPTFGVPVTVPSGVLSYAAASRFLEQASWGPDPASLARVMQIGRDAWTSEQFIAADSTYTASATPASGLAGLQSQFMRNALQNSDQLRQRVAFALGQIFVVSGVKLNSEAQMAPYQRLLLASAFGNFRTLLRDVTLSPSMGEYLDMVNNDKPSLSSPVVPNENYARELLQLFTIGTGSYTETDVKQLALAFTGWTYPPTTTTSVWPNLPNYAGTMVAFQSHHDTSAKTILGVTIPAGQTAAQDLNAALDAVFNHPNVPQFVSYRLIQHLVTGNPTNAYVSRVAAVFVNNGAGVRGDLKAVVRAILLDPEGATDDVTALGADQGHLREPVVYMLALLRGLGASLPANSSVADFALPMGQNLFYSPSVFNYFSPSYRIPGTTVTGPEFQILNGSTALARVNFALLLTHGFLSSVVVPFDRFDELAGDVPQLLDAISNALYRGQMQADMRGTITNAVSGFSDPFTRARTALFLAASHARYQVQR